MNSAEDLTVHSYLFVVLVLVVGLAALEVLRVLGPELLVEGAGDQAPLEQHLHRPRVAPLLRRALDLKVQVVAPVLQLGTNSKACCELCLANLEIQADWEVNDKYAPEYLEFSTQS